MTSVLSIATSGMAAAQKRLEVSARNVANDVRRLRAAHVAPDGAELLLVAAHEPTDLVERRRDGAPLEPRAVREHLGSVDANGPHDRFAIDAMHLRGVEQEPDETVRDPHPVHLRTTTFAVLRGLYGRIVSQRNCDCFDPF